MKRRNFIQSSAALMAAASPIQQLLANQTIRHRAIPSSGEELPVVGLGTWQTFDVGANLQQRETLKQVLQAFKTGGGSVIDSSPMYGSSESVVGDLASQLGFTDDFFMATKVWTSGEQAGIKQMRRSMQDMQKQKLDLLQVHNLLDAKTHLKTLAEWKKLAKVRYIGLTHYHSGGYAEMKRLMLSHKIDFIQINYSILSREADAQILPLARDRGIAVLINRPFATGNLFDKVRGKPLPEWCSEFDCHSWGQYFLKYILANDAVTCVIPGTSKVHHIKDNLMAGMGRLPNQQQRAEMLRTVVNL